MTEKMSEKLKLTVDNKALFVKIHHIGGTPHMESIVLSQVAGKIVGYELSEEGNTATIKVRGEDNKTVETVVNVSEDMPMPTGKVTIATTITFESPYGSATKKRAASTVKFYFGKNGKILVDPADKLPFPMIRGKATRDPAVEKRFKEVEKAAGGRADSNQTAKLKKEFSKSGRNPEEWNAHYGKNIVAKP